MYILDVVPIQKGINKETLSYFSARSVEIGAMVTVPLRKKGILGVVVARHDATQLKTNIKNADYQLRNIIGVQKKTLFTPEFIRACVLVKNYYLTTTGAVIASLVPQLFLDEFLESVPQQALTKKHENLIPDKSIFQAPFEERISYYKTLTRESFANEQSLFIMCPTIAHIERMQQLLSKGVESRVYIFHSKLTKKKIRECSIALLKEDHAVLIIATPGFLSLPLQNLETLIIEHESSASYQQSLRPFLDYRTFAETYAHIRGLKYIIADGLLRFESIWHAKEERYSEIKALSFHITKKNTPKVVSLRREVPEEGNNKEKLKKQEPFQIFSKETLAHIKKALRKKESILIFNARKGLAPLTVCEDCGSVLRSPESGRPLVLYQKKNGSKTTSRPVYQCPQTLEKFNAIDTCQMCGGWKLKMLGIGTDTVEKELLTHFPKVSVTIIDGTYTKTHTATKKTIGKWQKSQSSILIITEKALPYLSPKIVDHVIVSSFDSLFSLPHYTSDERVARIVLTLKEKAVQTFLIQTRLHEHRIFRAFEKGNLIDLYTTEMRERKALHFPPYGVLIRLGRQTTRNNSPQVARDLKTLLREFKPTITLEPGMKRGSLAVQAVIKFQTNDWISTTSPKYPGHAFKKLFSIAGELAPNYYWKIG